METVFEERRGLDLGPGLGTARGKAEVGLPHEISFIVTVICEISLKMHEI